MTGRGLCSLPAEGGQVEGGRAEDFGLEHGLSKHVLPGSGHLLLGCLGPAVIPKGTESQWAQSQAYSREALGLQRRFNQVPVPRLLQ